MGVMSTYAGRLQQLVLQPTPFCNLACTYCYLPHRDDQTVMSPEVLEAAFSFVKDARLASAHLEMRWHAGEPLAVPRRFYEGAFAQARRILSGGTAIHHSIQTNAVLLDEEWVDLLQTNDVRLGVSIDGPQKIHDARRLTRRGGGTFNKVMEGIRCLQASQFKFDVIAVITPETVRHADAFMDFFANLEGLNQLGLNIEETEGTHVSKAFSEDNFEGEWQEFLEGLMKWSQKTQIAVREFMSMRSHILAGAGSSMRNTQNEPFTIVSIASNGDLGTFSPELLGMVHPTFGNFTIGNVLSCPPNAIFSSQVWPRMVEGISHGTALCRSGCAYFSVCGGGAPINKLYEKHSFAIMETQHCRLTVKAVADVVLSAMEHEIGIHSLPQKPHGFSDAV